MPEDLELRSTVTEQHEDPLNNLISKLEQVDTKADNVFPIQASVATADYRESRRRLENLADDVDDIDDVAISAVVEGDGVNSDDLPDGYSVENQNVARGPDGQFKSLDEFDIDTDSDDTDTSTRGGFADTIATLEADVALANFDIGRSLNDGDLTNPLTDAFSDTETNGQALHNVLDEVSQRMDSSSGGDQYEAFLDALRQYETERDNDSDQEEIERVREAIENLQKKQKDSQSAVGDNESNESRDSTERHTSEREASTERTSRTAEERISELVGEDVTIESSEFKQTRSEAPSFDNERIDNMDVGSADISVGVADLEDLAVGNQIADAFEESDPSVENVEADKETVERFRESTRELRSKEREQNEQAEVERYHENLTERFDALGDINQPTQKLGRDDGTPDRRFLGDLTETDRDISVTIEGDVRELTGVGPSLADTLESEDITSIRDVSETERDLTEIRGIGDSRAETLSTEASEYVERERRRLSVERAPDRETVTNRLDELVGRESSVGARLPWERLQERHDLRGSLSGEETFDQVRTREAMRDIDPVEERLAWLEGAEFERSSLSVEMDEDAETQTATADGIGGFGGTLSTEEINQVRQDYEDEFDWEGLLTSGGALSQGEILDPRDIEGNVDFDALGEAVANEDAGAVASAQRFFSGNRRFGDRELLQSKGILRRDNNGFLDKTLDKIQELEPSMSGFYNVLASLIPLLVNFVFAIPAAITALAALATAAVGAAGLLAAVAGLGLYGMLNTPDGFSMEPLKARLRGVGENIKENFLPLAESFEPLVDFGFGRLNDMIDELGGHTQLFSGFRDETRGVIDFMANRIPDIIVALAKMGDAMSPIFAAIGQWMDIPAAIAWMHTELTDMMPALYMFASSVVAMIPPLVNLSKGFLIVASGITAFLSGIVQFIGTYPLLATIIGLVIASLTTLIGLLYTAAVASSVLTTAMGVLGITSMSQLVPSLGAAMSALAGLKSSFIAAATGATVLTTALRTLLLASGIGAIIAALGFVAEQAMKATSELQNLNNVANGMGGFNASYGGYGSSGVQGQYINYSDNSRTIVNSSDRDNGIREAQRANYYEGSATDKKLSRPNY